tara:strand:- start:82 stop:522 length:441 start_codon:yes stop_codon:yes gene_type:complete
MAVQSLHDSAYKEWANYTCNNLDVRGVSYNKIITATQDTSATTDVEFATSQNCNSGLLTTVSQTLAAYQSLTFQVHFDSYKVGDIVLASIQNYSGTYVTHGLPVINVEIPSVNGVFEIKVMNCHNANALAGTLKIGFKVIKKTENV